MQQKSNLKLAVDLPEFILLQMRSLSSQNQTHDRLQLRHQQRQLAQNLSFEMLQHQGVEISAQAGTYPGWPKDWLSSISHSGEWVAVALAQKSILTHLGVDCERVLNSERADRLAKRILTAKDRLEWPKTGLDWQKFVTLCFCIKESAYKSLTAIEQKPLGFYNFAVEFDKTSAHNGFVVTVNGPQSGNPLVLKGQFGDFGRVMLSLVWRDV